MGIGKGAIVKIIRSGMVIPLITEVIKKVTPDVPTHCPCCGTKLVWNKTNTHLTCTNENCDDRRFKTLVFFFNIMDVDGMREGTIRILFDNGYDSIEKILNMQESDFLKLPGFAQSKSTNLYNSIKEKMTDAQLAIVQHASTMFPGLGSKQLQKLEHFDTKPLLTQVMQISGFSDTLANAYVNNYDKFFNWLHNLPITIAKPVVKQINVNGKFAGKTVVFTGIRDQELEDYIVMEGGNVGSGVNKKTDYLVCKQVGSGSGKEEKANQLGIKIVTIDQFRLMCK